MPYGKMDSIKKNIISCRLFTLPVLCLCLSLVTLPRTSCAPTTPKPTQNITVTVPEGTQSHGSPDLICTPTRWTDVAIFFLANYVAHAATIKSFPGEPALLTLRVLISALCLPVSGVTRGLKAIRQRAIFSSTLLEIAANAGALCVVVRTPEWVPQKGDVACVSGFQFPKSSNRNRPRDRQDILNKLHLRIRQNSIHFLPIKSNLESKGRKVHGICCLPHGYALALLPARAPIMEIPKSKRDEMGIAKMSSWCQQLKEGLKTLRHTKHGRPATEDGTELRVSISEAYNPSDPDIPPEIELSSNYNLPKGVIALFHTLYASATLYRTRGDQIQRYGYAASGLTVAPYLVMSIVNLLGTILTPDYPCIYLVRSEIMDEASRRKGAKFEGMVATLKSEPVTVRKHVEFCIDEDKRIFVRGPSDSTSQRGLRDADDVVSIEIVHPDQVELRGILIANSIRKFYNVWHPTVWITEGLDVSDDHLPRLLSNLIDLWANIFVGSIPIAINGGLSHFGIGHSTIAQRAWTMTWLAFGLYFGLYVSVGGLLFGDSIMNVPLTMTMCFVPAIGGFVVVAQMLMSYGRCIEVSEANF